MSALEPLQIGSIRTTTNLVLSPMSGVTDTAFRRLVQACSGDAVGLLVSEFIAAEGLSRDDAKTLRMLRFHESERPIAMQIFGADVDRMVRAAMMVEEAGAEIVDINCGCPAPKVVKRGGGAGLMKQPDRLREILRAVRAAVSIPLTLKIRSGWDDEHLNALECAKIAEGEGAAMLAVHGRTRLQLYRGSADWDVVRMLHGAVSIPVLGSGDIVTPADLARRIDGRCADGYMIGRGALGNPWVFRQARDYLEGRPVAQPDSAGRVAAMQLFRDFLREDLPERAFLGRYRGLGCRLVKFLPGAALARQAIGVAGTAAAIDRVVEDFLLGGSSPATTSVAA